MKKQFSGLKPKELQTFVGREIRVKIGDREKQRGVVASVACGEGYTSYGCITFTLQGQEKPVIFLAGAASFELNGPLAETDLIHFTVPGWGEGTISRRIPRPRHEVMNHGVSGGIPELATWEQLNNAASQPPKSPEEAE